MPSSLNSLPFVSAKLHLFLEDSILGRIHRVDALNRVLERVQLKINRIKYGKKELQQQRSTCITLIASGESIWGSCSKKGRLLKNK